MNGITFMDARRYMPELLQQMSLKELKEVEAHASSIVVHLNQQLATFKPVGIVASEQYRKYQGWKRGAINAQATHNRILANARAEIAKRRTSLSDAIQVKKNRILRQMYKELLTWDLSEEPHLKALLEEYEEVKAMSREPSETNELQGVNNNDH